MLRLLFAALFLVTTARAAEPHPSLPPPVIPDCLGVNIHFTDPKPGELEMLAAAGFKWVRMDFGWGGTERKKGEYDFSAFDRLAAALDQFKIRAVFILDYGNPLYADPGDKSPFTSRANTPEFREAFGKWAVAAVQHFKGRGYLWEMWNEPNGGFWKSPDKTGDYIALAKSTGEALRQAGLLGPKGEAFIGPATSTIDLPYLEACFKAGLLDYWDAVSVHPYRQTAPETVEEEYRSVRLLIRKYAPKDKVIPIISGEWGYSSAWSGMGKDEAARAEQQGKYLPRQFLTNIANDVALSIWYDWHDDGTDPKEGEHRFGIVSNEYHAGRDPVYDPKPAYEAAKALTTQLNGYRFNKRLIIELIPKPRSYALLFSKDAPQMAEVSSGEPRELAAEPGAKLAAPAYRDVMYAAWQMPNRWKMYSLLPASAGRFDVTSHTGVQLPALDATQRPIANADRFQETVEVNLTDEPLYLRPVLPNRILSIAAAWDRVPLDVFARAPAVLNVSTTVRNPFSIRPLNMHHGDGNGKLVNTRIEPRQSYEMVSKKSLHRTDEPERSFVGMTADHSYLHQRLELFATNPIRATVLPFMGGTFPVRIENLSDEPYRGEADMEVNQPEALGSLRNLERMPMTLAPWESRIISFRWADKKPGSYGFLFHLDAHEPQPLNYTMDATSLKVVPVGEFADTTGDPAVSNFKLVADGDAKVAAEQSMSWIDAPEGLPVPGTKALKISYRMGAGWKFLRLVPKTDMLAQIESTNDLQPSSVGMWIHGDGVVITARLRFVDSTGQTLQMDGGKIDWKGWRYVTFPISGLQSAFWGGANDGAVHYPIKWDTLFLLDNASRQPVEGEVYLSAPTLIY